MTALAGCSSIQDTDLGHASVVLTADDFAFFVSEYELDPDLVLKAPKVQCQVVLTKKKLQD